MRDFRNDFIKEIQVSIINDLDQQSYDKVMSVVFQVINKYEISERCTDIVPYDSANTTLLQMYTSTMIINGKSDGTIKAYIRQLQKFIIFIGGKNLKEVSTFDIKNYLANEKVRGISNTTLENIRAILSSFYQWMTNEEFVQRNPCSSVQPIKCGVKERQPFSQVEIDALRNNCVDSKQRAIVEMLLTSGVRVQELVDLNIEDIDFSNKSICVKHGKGDKERYTYFSDVACEYLIQYLTSKNITSGAVFIGQRGNRYTTRGIRALLKSLQKRSMVDNVHPHRFRRTFATTMARRGMDIQDIKTLMGHTNINTTMVYISLDRTAINCSYLKHIA